MLQKMNQGEKSYRIFKLIFKHLVWETAAWTCSLQLPQNKKKYENLEKRIKGFIKYKNVIFRILEEKFNRL